MTRDDVVKALGICSDPDIEMCDGCPYAQYGDCNRRLKSDSLYAIKTLEDRMKVAEETVNRLQLDKETMEEMLEQKYTKKQLVQAVNDIFEDTETEDLNTTGQAVGAFLRLIDADGYMAVLPDGTVEIRLEGESECK